MTPVSEEVQTVWKKFTLEDSEKCASLLHKVCQPDLVTHLIEQNALNATKNLMVFCLTFDVNATAVSKYMPKWYSNKFVLRRSRVFLGQSNRHLLTSLHSPYFRIRINASL